MIQLHNNMILRVEFVKQNMNQTLKYNCSCLANLFFFHSTVKIFAMIPPKFFFLLERIESRGGLRGARADALLPQGLEPLPTQRISPLYYFEISIFGDGP